MGGKAMARVLAAVLVGLILWTAVVVLIPFAKDQTFWIAYGFGCLALASQAFFLARVGDDLSVGSRLYKLPLAVVGAAYLAAQVVLSIVLMAANTGAAGGVPGIVAFSSGIVLAVLAALGAPTDDGKNTR